MSPRIFLQYPLNPFPGQYAAWLFLVICPLSLWFVAPGLIIFLHLSAFNGIVHVLAQSPERPPSPPTLQIWLHRSSFFAVSPILASSAKCGASL